MKHAKRNPDSKEFADLDEKYWRETIRQRPYYDPARGFDRYRWALQYGIQSRRKHREDVDFSTVMDELAAGWSKFGGPSGLSWEEASAAVRDAWEHQPTLMAESIASKGGYKKPPTFTQHGETVPRNIDEPNR
ncbi:MAG TPA: hypothetical protein VHD56_07825 [Tepidisphaeraceae bacterium]|nr:hypothetical protein [Tepidisphaeraceae bacterium]